MSKNKLFDEESVDENVIFKIENEYAKKYDKWREKEELHKLEQKYGSKVLKSDASLSSDSEDESDEPVDVNEEMETQFLKTLAMLKNKDPRIYDPNYNFFENKEKEIETKPKSKTLSFADSDDEDDDDAEIFKIEKVAKQPEQEAKNEEYAGKTPKEDKLKNYLIGKVDHIDDNVEKDLAPLKALWSDPKLNEGEAFLRDYILNKRYLEEGDAGDAGDKIRDDEDLKADEQTVEEQGKFERAYNFRFEEPDEEYLKRFPRTMNYIRPKDDKRSRKRAEVRTRKEEEKQRKMEEIARLKALKLKEIQEKIAKLKEVTGNDDLAFKDEDIEGDFDPEEHDRRMQAIFNEQYYGDADEEKPIFPDLDVELEIENWEKYEEDYNGGLLEQNGELHCEDEDFNMDADYNPKQAKANLLEELKRNLGKKRRNRKRKSKLAKLLETEKPKFIPTTVDKSYSEFMEEYYKMDCEDIIGGDLPTRFKYREVVPNDFGLTVEEILLADDKELTQWVPLKKIVKYRPENLEKGEVKTYAQKAADVKLKRKILPSLFKDLPEEPEIPVPGKKKKKKEESQKVSEDRNLLEVTSDPQDNNIMECKAKKKKKKLKENITELGSNSNENNKTDNEWDIKFEEQENDSLNNEHNETVNKSVEERDVKKKKYKNNVMENIEHDDGLHNQYSNLIKQNITETKHKKKNKRKVNTNISNSQNEINVVNMQNVHQNNLKRKMQENMTDSNTNPKKRKKDKNKFKKETSLSHNVSTNTSKEFKHKNKEKFKNKQHKEKSGDPLSKLSDERLKAYGLNPKKYRGFLKYKKF